MTWPQAGPGGCRGRGSRARLEHTSVVSAAPACTLHPACKRSLQTWPTFHPYWWEEAGFPPTPSPPVLLSMLHPAPVSLEGSHGWVPQHHPEIWSGAHPSLRPASLGTIPALVSYLSDLKWDHFGPAVHLQDAEDCVWAGKGYQENRLGDEDGCRHSLKLNKAAGICTPLGTWLCLPVVWQQDFLSPLIKPWVTLVQLLVEGQQNHDKKVIQDKNNVISSKGGREDREEKHNL